MLLVLLLLCAPLFTQLFAQQYVDAKVCGACHAQIAHDYHATGMARSFYRPSAASVAPEPKPFYHASTGAYYAMVLRDGKYYQRRWQAGGTYLQEWRVDYVMGSGNHVRTYLHRSASGTLIELPLAWYAEDSWAMNPGYDADHFITPRKIAYECMFCHNAYPRVPAGHERANSVPVYADPLPEGIDCQRCDGPGQHHVGAAQAGVSGDALRRTIVNPARLSGDRQMEVCMQCHLQTTSLRLPAQIRRFDRGPFSYRAGEPLAAFALFFDRGVPPKDFEIVNSVVRLRASRCFIESKGALTCLTCHDPHNIPRGEQAAAHYNGVCRQCHATVAAAAHPSDPNCISCHMPKRRTDDVVHAVMTDHLIQRRAPPNPLAPIQETHETEATAYHGAVVPYYPKAVDPIYLAVAQVEHASNLDQGIEQLTAEIARQKPARAEFYFQLGEAWRIKGDAPRAIAAYEQAARRDPGSAWILRRCADASIAAGQSSRAASLLNRAVQLTLDDARGWYALGELDADSGRASAAIAAFKKSTQLDPDSPETFNALGSVLAESGSADAERAFESALRIQPDLADAQANLGMLLASKNELTQAAGHFERALTAEPGNTVARCNFAIALAKLHRPQEAEKQLRTAVQIDPKMAQAHDLLGSLLDNEGRRDAALQEYREALRLRPGEGRFELDLGIALAENGDLAGAAEYLRKAAAGSDPAVAEAARQVLGRIKK